VGFHQVVVSFIILIVSSSLLWLLGGAPVWDKRGVVAISDGL